MTWRPGPGPCPRSCVAPPPSCPNASASVFVHTAACTQVYSLSPHFPRWFKPALGFSTATKRSTGATGGRQTPESGVVHPAHTHPHFTAQHEQRGPGACGGYMCRAGACGGVVPPGEWGTAAGTRRAGPRLGRGCGALWPSLWAVGNFGAPRPPPPPVCTRPRCHPTHPLAVRTQTCHLHALKSTVAAGWAQARAVAQRALGSLGPPDSPAAAGPAPPTHPGCTRPRCRPTHPLAVHTLPYHLHASKYTAARRCVVRPRAHAVCRQTPGAVCTAASCALRNLRAAVACTPGGHHRTPPPLSPQPHLHRCSACMHSYSKVCAGACGDGGVVPACAVRCAFRLSRPPVPPTSFSRGSPLTPPKETRQLVWHSGTVALRATQHKG
jgi:hypothetical protein